MTAWLVSQGLKRRWLVFFRRVHLRGGIAAELAATSQSGGYAQFGQNIGLKENPCGDKKQYEPKFHCFLCVLCHGTRTLSVRQARLLIIPSWPRGPGGGLTGLQLQQPAAVKMLS